MSRAAEENRSNPKTTRNRKMSDRPLSTEGSTFSRHTRYPSTDGHDDSLYNQSHSRKAPDPAQSDQVQRFAGLAIGMSSMFAEQILSHPFIVLRRQCQVQHDSDRFHLTPFTLMPVLWDLPRRQGIGTLWKGLGSVFVTRGIFMVAETAISEFTPFPKEVSRHSSLKKIGQHFLLKGLAYITTTPFYVSSLIETVQSDIASEGSGVLDCVYEGWSRLLGLGMPQTTRLVPIWYLFLPTATIKLSQYVVMSIAHYTVTSAIKIEEQDKRGNSTPVDGHSKSMYDTYFPELLAAFTGNLIADVMLYPFETVIHRLYVQGTRIIIDKMDTGSEVIPLTTHYQGVFDCFRTIVMEEGVAGLYKGFGALVLQYCLHAAILKLAKLLFQKISKEFHTPSVKEFRSYN